MTTNTTLNLVMRHFTDIALITETAPICYDLTDEQWDYQMDLWRKKHPGASDLFDLFAQYTATIETFATGQTLQPLIQHLASLLDDPRLSLQVAAAKIIGLIYRHRHGHDQKQIKALEQLYQQAANHPNPLVRHLIDNPTD